MAEHARLSPSGAKRWFACPGSLVLEAPFPNKSSPYADAGTAMHAVAAWCLTDHKRASTYVGLLVEVSAKGEPTRHVPFTTEMAETTQGYVDTVRQIGIGNQLYVEICVDFSEFIGVPEQFGTADAIVINADQGELMVIDLKTGHTVVSAEENVQLMFYALGTLAMLRDGSPLDTSDAFQSARDAGLKTVRLAIYQPSAGGLSEWTCTLDDLEHFAVKAKAKAAKAADAQHDHGRLDPRHWETVYLNPNPNDVECAFCRAMPTCPSAQRKVEETVGAAFDVIVEQKPEMATESLTPDDLDLKMQATSFVEDWVKAVRAETERRLLAGTEMPSFGLELGRKGARKFADEAEAEKLVRESFRLKAELAYDMKLKSPTSFEKMAKPGADGTPAVIKPKQWAKLSGLIVQDPPKPSVKPKSQIKNPYTPPQPDAQAFDNIAEDDLWN
jgi:hypothetical protein